MRNRRQAFGGSPSHPPTTNLSLSKAMAALISACGASEHSDRQELPQPSTGVASELPLYPISVEFSFYLARLIEY